MLVAYLINQYPKVSHSFIRREIAELERQGWQVQRIALRRCGEPLADPADLAEASRTAYIQDSWRSPLRLAAAVLLLALRHPLRLAQAGAIALRTGWRAQRPLPWQLAYLAEACLLARWLQRSGARHLHAHFGTNGAQVAMLAAVLGSLPYSFTVHGPEEFDHAQPLRLRDKVQRACFVAAVSHYGRSQLFRCLPHADWHKVHVIPCGLTPDYAAGTLTPPGACHRLLCIGRLCEQKGQLLLPEALHRLALRGVRPQLVLAGDGDLRQALEALIAHFDLARQVRITGWLSGEQLRQEILAARAVVLPSFAEGLPVALMEAMALHRPVLSTYIAGIPELVQPGENGWLIPAGDLDALVQALGDILATPAAVLERMGHNASQCVQQRHDLRRSVAQLAAHFAPGEAA